MNLTTPTKRWRRLLSLAFSVTIATLAIAGPAVTASAAPNSGTGVDGVGLPTGTIKHVWLIILENKSYDETFTGLNNNSYLWQTLPSEGVLLKNYYGTGHTSQDNYIALASGQSPQQDTQGDCASVNSAFGSNSTITTTGSIGSDTPNWNYGQVVSALGANQGIGSNPSNTNGCTYPTDIPTLFDQFNAAGVSWKGYAQDLGGAQPIGSSSYVSDSVPGREDAACGAPGSALNNPVSTPTYLSGAQGFPIGTPTITSTVTSAAIASGHTVITDTSQSFTAAVVGKSLQITGGTGKGEGGTVTAETATTLTIATLPVLPDSTSTYNLGPADTTSYTGASLVAGTGTTNNPQYSDQYVAKHFPFPWFASLTGGGAGNPMGTPLTEPATGTNCDANHIANLDDPTHGLIADLTNNTVPNFSWITPNNCSDAHDTTCKGNNLSGAFGTYTSGPHAGQVNLNDPLYTHADGLPSNIPEYDPEATTPVNFTGGLYASDLFLAYYLPLIETSQAYQDGGLVDITFDEGEASFTYSGNSFNNVLTNSTASVGTPAQPAGQGTSSPQGSAPADAPSYGTGGSTAPGAKTIYGAYGIAASAAGENINGTNVFDEPFGPNTTLQTDGSGNQLYPGPGDNLSIDRPPACTNLSPLTPADCVPGILRGASGSSPGARTDTVTGGGGTSIVTYPAPASGQSRPGGRRHRAGGHRHHHGRHGLHLRHQRLQHPVPQRAVRGNGIRHRGALPGQQRGSDRGRLLPGHRLGRQPGDPSGQCDLGHPQRRERPGHGGRGGHRRPAVGRHRPDPRRW